jgi:hypothetical protein
MSTMSEKLALQRSLMAVTRNLGFLRNHSASNTDIDGCIEDALGSIDNAIDIISEQIGDEDEDDDDDLLDDEFDDGPEDDEGDG